MSRILEATALGWLFGGEGALLVLGDIPIRCNAKQTVFVQTPHLTNASKPRSVFDTWKYRIARYIFRVNSPHVHCFIVQTEAMKSALTDTFPEIGQRIRVVPQPAPKWLLASGLTRTHRLRKAGSGLSLLYPAVGYPHKNHRLLGQATSGEGSSWSVSELILTIPAEDNPNFDLPWIKCVGFLSPEEVIERYEAVDSLVFLSVAESYGFPLVEAMWIGLPVVCPDLPYAHVLCGDQAIYFDPYDCESLRQALTELSKRLDDGWWPDWAEQLRLIPSSWDQVACEMLQLVVAGDAPPSGPCDAARPQLD